MAEKTAYFLSSTNETADAVVQNFLRPRQIMKGKSKIKSWNLSLFRHNFLSVSPGQDFVYDSLCSDPNIYWIFR